MIRTDTPNPFAIAGFSVLEELDNFVAGVMVRGCWLPEAQLESMLAGLTVR